MGKLVRAKTLSDATGLPLGTIRDLANAGRIPCVAINARVKLFDADAVLRAIAASSTAVSSFTGLSQVQEGE